MPRYSDCKSEGCVGKTTTTSNLGIGLARQGKRVLLIDADAQGSLTASLGYREPDKLDITLANVMGNIINEEEMDAAYGILRHEEGVDLMPGNIELSGVEVSLVNVMSRETVLRSYIEEQRSRYDYILIDCMPSLGMLTINAVAAADSILIPVQAAYLPVKGLEQLIKTIGKVKRQINHRLEIEGILMTMVDSRTTYARDISKLLIENYGSRVRIFNSRIPMSVRAAEISAEGTSIYKHDSNGIPWGQVRRLFNWVRWLNYCHYGLQLSYVKAQLQKWLITKSHTDCNMATVVALIKCIF